MRTIGNHWPRSAPLGDYTATCDYCGVPYRRSQLRYDGDFKLVCPDEGEGMAVGELDEANREAMRMPGDYPQDGGAYVVNWDTTEPTPMKDKTGAATLTLNQYLNPTFGKAP